MGLIISINIMRTLLNVTNFFNSPKVTTPPQGNRLLHCNASFFYLPVEFPKGNPVQQGLPDKRIFKVWGRSKSYGRNLHGTLCMIVKVLTGYKNRRLIILIPS